jgi:diguanylate cyclase (GGDEF)-like protein/PAS domain S-box-containing protein
MMVRVRSARGRALAAVIILLPLVVAVALLATWRAKQERSDSEALEQRAAVVASLEDAQAQFFRGAVLITAAVFIQDPVPLIASYRQVQVEGDESLEQARTGLIALGESSETGALDSFAEQMGQLRQEVDTVLTVGVIAERSTRVELGLQYYPQMWPKIEAMMATLEQLSGEQQAELVDARAAADQASDANLALLIGFSMLAFLGGAALLVALIISIVRPLSALRESARAVASGNLEVRAKIAGPEEVASLARDFNQMVAERERAEQALRESEAKYRRIFESIQDILYRTDAQGIIVEISPSVQRFGYTREQMIGTQVMDVYENPEQRSTLVKAVIEQGDVADHEIRLRRGDGRVIDVSVSAHVLRDEDGTFIGTEGTLRDVSDRKAVEEALREQTRRDPLTGILNHGAIVGEMRRLISVGEDAAPWAMAMIDVNRLKATNDTYGHQVGDAVLSAVAAALSMDGALAGRYGGDEFVVILPGADRQAAERYCGEAMDALARATVTDPQTGERVPVQASIGLALFPEDARTLAGLINASDSAMYAAKRQRPARRAA